MLKGGVTDVENECVRDLESISTDGENECVRDQESISSVECRSSRVC